MTSSKSEKVGKFNSIDDLLQQIKHELDDTRGSRTKKKVSMIFACNSSGKTRLSKSIYDQHKGKVLYYNAFTEDLITWDNKNFVLNFDETKWIFQTIETQGLYGQVTKNFQEFTGSSLEPKFNIQEGQVTFKVHSDDNSGNIKISRGEERVFIWSIFFTVLNAAIESLNDSSDIRSTTDFDSFKYVVIDDPVSSMDDTRIITIALELINLIQKSKSDLKFLITTHHALFFNVLFNFRENKWDRKNYILSKYGEELHLKRQRSDSPFAYHHTIISDIQEAIKNDDLKRHHFNLFRTLLEKTSNFLGRSSGWKKLLPDEEFKILIKTLDHYSHNRLSELEPKDLSEDEIRNFESAFYTFMAEFNLGGVENE